MEEKGITIKFGADTSELEAKIKGINKTTRSLDAELRKVNTALKFNPGSVDLWRQKQTILTQKVKETEDKLKALKQQQQAMDTAGVDKNSAEYRKMQREIIETESKLKTFKGQLRQVGNVKLKALSGQLKQAGQSITNAGQALRGLSIAGAAVVAGLGAMAYKAATTADDLNTLSKVYNINTRDLQKYGAAAALVDVDVDTIAKSHVRLEKAMNSAKDGTGASAEAFAQLGVDVTNADGSLRTGDAVWQDTIKALGTMTNETERDAVAMQLMGKSASELNPLIEDGGETYKNVSDTLAKYGLDFVDQETLDKANQFNDSIDMIKTIGLVTVQSLGAELAGYLAPALAKAVELVGKLAEFLSGLSPQVLTVIGVIGGVVAGLAPVLIVVGKLATGISSIINLISIVGPAMAGLAGPIGIVIAVIAGLVTAGILLYKNWDTIKKKAAAIKASLIATWTNIKTSVVNAVNNLKTRVTGAFTSLRASISNVFSGVVSRLTQPFRTARDIIRGIIDKIKGFFNFSTATPHVKLPHFSISPSGWKVSDLLKGKIPKLGIKWYAEGGIFNAPTVLSGVGEAGPEAVVPLDKLWRQMEKMNTGGGDVYTINVYAREGMDVEALAREVQKRIIEANKRRTQAWA